MKMLKKKYRLGFLIVLMMFLVAFIFYFLITRSHRIESSVSSIDQLPYIGQYLKLPINKGNIKYVQLNTFGVTQILFTGHASEEDMKLYENDPKWYYSKAIYAKNALGDIYDKFKVQENDYPISFTEEDIVIDTPSIRDTRLVINYMPDKNRFTGKAVIVSRR